jgi:hypothetical protein
MFVNGQSLVFHLITISLIVLDFRCVALLIASTFSVFIFTVGA